MGSSGSLTELKANNHGNDREIGQTDTYIITDNTDIGEFRCVSIRIDGDDGWIITEVWRSLLLRYRLRNNFDKSDTLKCVIK